MQLDIILRVHDKGNVHATPRALDVPKAEIVERCARSLGTALGVTHDAVVPRLTAVMDQTSIITDTMLQDVFNSQIEPNAAEETGNSASLKKVIELAVKSKADAVLLLEDDYLWEPDGLRAMIEAWEEFNTKSPKPIALHPGDDDWNYVHHHPCRVVASKDRMWRTNQLCTGTMMIAPETIRRHKGVFDILAKTAKESISINNLWGQYIELLTPLKPCAYHLNENVHPVYDYTELWEKNKCMHTLKMAV